MACGRWITKGLDKAPKPVLFMFKLRPIESMKLEPYHLIQEHCMWYNSVQNLLRRKRGLFKAHLSPRQSDGVSGGNFKDVTISMHTSRGGLDLALSYWYKKDFQHDFYLLAGVEILWRSYPLWFLCLQAQTSREAAAYREIDRKQWSRPFRASQQIHGRLITFPGTKTQAPSQICMCPV